LPFSGKITESSAEVGQLLSNGRSFAKAFSLAAIELVVPLAASDVEALSPIEGRSADLILKKQTIASRVERMSAELDPRSRFARAYIPVQLTQDIQPGVFLDVRLAGPEIANTMVLPEATSQANNSIWIVREGLLEKFMPLIKGRNEEGIIVAAFDFADGIVVGAIPGAEENQVVRVNEFKGIN
jgi:multidrug efflux pump subunit AcrA (membrane-fusion protein)